MINFGSEITRLIFANQNNRYSEVLSISVYIYSTQTITKRTAQGNRPMFITENDSAIEEAAMMVSSGRIGPVVARPTAGRDVCDSSSTLA